MKIKFLVAEEIRMEMGGKLTILGLFPDDNIRMIKGDRPEGASPDMPEGLERLAFLISISELSSKKIHKFKGRITDPSGAVYKPEESLGEGRIEKGTSRSIIVEMKPFIVKTEGVYHFDFSIDKEVLSFPFEIREQAKPRS